MLKCIKDWINNAIAATGYRLTSTRAQPWQPTLAAGLRRLAARNLPLQTLIDVGAADGGWARQAIALLPSCRNQLLIKAQSVHRPALATFHRDFPQSHVVMAVAGPECGEVSFHANSPWDGAASAVPQQGDDWVRLPQTSIDHEIAIRGLSGPFLIKLDVHGYERAVLAGARAALAQTEALIVECYNVEMGRDTQRFPDFCRNMETLGFRCADLWDPLYIGHQNTLWQFDLLFLRAARVAAADPVSTVL
ncbi:MAG: FkbM family methyltransferase [Opitutaceae bacterium]|nr:FkbM family methyltransferase [Opitutaceae bacterium]